MRINLSRLGAKKLLIRILSQTQNVTEQTQNFTMVNTFFGLDLKTGAKVIIFSTLIENLIFYVLSLALMLNNSKEDESQYRGVLLYLEEIENHVTWGKIAQTSFESFN